MLWLSRRWMPASSRSRPGPRRRWRDSRCGWPGESPAPSRTCLLTTVAIAAYDEGEANVRSEDVIEFGGWPQPPRWAWVVAGVAVAAVLAGVVVARTGPHHAASSPTAAALLQSSRTPAAEFAPQWWPSPASLCGPAVYLPQLLPIRPPPGGPVLVQPPAGAPVRMRVWRTGPHQAVPGGVSFWSLPATPGHGLPVPRWSPGGAPAASCR
jgi:hypothetical protein